MKQTTAPAANGSADEALETLRQHREVGAHGGQYRSAVDRIGIAHARAVTPVDVARLFHALDDRSRTRIGVIDDRAAVHLCGSAVRQHARCVEGERVAVAAVGGLGRGGELLSERRLEEIDLRKIEDVEPQHASPRPC